MVSNNLNSNHKFPNYI